MVTMKLTHHFRHFANYKRAESHFMDTFGGSLITANMAFNDAQEKIFSYFAESEWCSGPKMASGFFRP